MVGGSIKLSWSQRRFLALLAVPAFGIALAYTVATTYAPVLIADALSPTAAAAIENAVPGDGGGPAGLATGLIVGGEGIFALLLPLTIGTWSDRIRTPLGARVPFLLGGAAMAAVGLVLLGPVDGGRLLGIIVALGLFFLGYFTYYSPYYALFPDLVGDTERGRALGFAGTARSAGLLVGLIAGALLIGLWRPLPFLVAAGGVVLATVALCAGGRAMFAPDQHGPGAGGPAWRAQLDLLRQHPSIRRWSAGNVLWEAAVAALKVFVVLYLTRGLGLSFLQTAGALALVGLAAVLAAPVAGTLADRYGHRPVMLVATWGSALGMLIPVVTTNTVFVLGILPVAFCVVMLLTLPFAMLMGMLPARADHGTGAGLFGLTSGLGVLIGPLLAGTAITLLHGVPALAFAPTRGYAAAFAVASGLLLVSVPLLHTLRDPHRRAQQHPV